MENSNSIALLPNNVESDDSGNKIEIYRKGELVRGNNYSDAEMYEEIKKRKELCNELDLKTQAQFCEKETGKIEYAKQFYPILTGYEINLIKIFLPKTYSRNKDEWKQYQFDIIPTKVLEEISIANSIEIFDNFEIWTPEQVIKDPVAIGEIIESPRRVNYFVISRWGEALKPFKDIEKMIRSRFIKHDSFRFIPAIVKDIIEEITQKSMVDGTFLQYEYIGRAKKICHCEKRMCYCGGMEHSSSDKAEKHFLICSECGVCIETDKAPKILFWCWS